MNSSEKRVLVTGATGLIGRELAEPLREAGFDVYAITIDENNPSNGIYWVKGNLFDEPFVRNVMADVKPTHLLNMAWATTGDYLNSDVNYSFLQAGITLARTFSDNGGKRAVYAGTCFEYKFKDSPLVETDELEPEKFTYTFCKDILRRIVSKYFEDHGVSFGYGRIFYVFGNGESKTRLTGMVFDRLANNMEVVIRSGEAIKDYFYSKDIAAAFCKFLDGNVGGCVNICSGNAISIEDYVLKLARAVGKEKLIKFLPLQEKDNSIIVGDNRRLMNEIGYKSRWPIDRAITDILEPDINRRR